MSTVPVFWLAFVRLPSPSQARAQWHWMVTSGLQQRGLRRNARSRWAVEVTGLPVSLPATAADGSTLIERREEYGKAVDGRKSAALSGFRGHSAGKNSGFRPDIMPLQNLCGLHHMLLHHMVSPLGLAVFHCGIDHLMMILRTLEIPCGIPAE